MPKSYLSVPSVLAAEIADIEDACTSVAEFNIRKLYLL